MKPFRTMWYRMFARHPYAYLGPWLIKCLPPAYVARVRETFFSGDGPSGVLAKIVRAAINQRYYAQPDEAIRRANRAAFWGGAVGKRWHEVKRKRYRDCEMFEKEFMKFRSPLIAQIEHLLSSTRGYHTICEIGTGHGMFLEYLARRLAFTTIGRFIGIDLNQEQIRENQQTYAHRGLEFTAMEVTDWIHTRGATGTIFVAVGTLECFTQQELEELLELIHQHASPTAVAISEPINLDLATETRSKPRGSAAWSHNYPVLFLKHGYQIAWQEVCPIDPTVLDYHNVLMVATAR